MAAKKPTPMRDYFRATGQQLREWSATDEAAQAEIDRRKARRAEKAAARATSAA